MKVKRLINLLLYFFTALLLSNAQNEPTLQRVNFSTPEAASFESMKRIPVSQYTGCPDISIPLWRVSNGKITHNITLRYLATAIKVDQESTWVGLNWNLDVGGMIVTRKSFPPTPQLAEWDLNKLLNEYSYTTITGSDISPAPMIKVNGFHAFQRADYGYNRYPTVYSSRYNEIPFEAYGSLIDGGMGEAEKYSAFFDGQSIDFVYHPLEHRYIILGKEKNYKLDSTPDGFAITNNEGIKYIFDYSVGVSTNLFTNTNNPTLFLTYYLTRIEHPTGKSLTFEYSEPTLIRTLPELTETYYVGSPAESNFIIREQFQYSCDHQNVYLKSITSGDQKITFHTIS